MKYIKEYINFDDIVDEEYNDYEDDIQVGDLVKTKDGNSLRTSKEIIPYSYNNPIRGDIEGDYEIGTYDNYKFRVDEIKYKEDGTKLIRFKSHWPYHVSSYWKKVNINESIDFDDIDYEEEYIHPDFIGHEDFYNFLVDNNVFDEFINYYDPNFEKRNEPLDEYLEKCIKFDYITNAFYWMNTEQGHGFWEELNIKWRK